MQRIFKNTRLAKIEINISIDSYLDLLLKSWFMLQFLPINKLEEMKKNMQKQKLLVNHCEGVTLEQS